MNGSLRLRGAEPGAVAVEATAALRHVEGLGHAEPILLAYHPISRMNPYQALLYRATWEHGIAPVPLRDLAELDELLPVAAAAGARLVVHLHWTNAVLGEAADETEGRERIDAFLAGLDRFIVAGGSLVWTVHNAIPHDAHLPLLEAELQQAIVDRSAVVHVLSSTTPATVAEWFTIPPDRILHVPHPNYIGAYVDVVSREQARLELGIEPDETVYAMLGALRPYKGGDQLLNAFDALLDRAPGRRRLLIAGRPADGPLVDAFLERCAIHPFVSLHAQRIPNEDMQYFLRAADAVVLPYLRSLNSGVLMLALSFGVPVVAPVGDMAGVVTPEIGRTFTGGDEESLIASLLGVDELKSSTAHEAAYRVAVEHDPGRLSTAFARGLVERLRQPKPASEAAGTTMAGLG